jgi:hypothetical protein
MQDIAVGVSAKHNVDSEAYCHNLADEMKAMTAQAKIMTTLGMRVTTASIAAPTMYAAEPIDDPILIMLEELGVPMTHVKPNDPRGGYWEYIPLNASTGVSEISTKYPTDFWLYDSRSEHTHLAEKSGPASPHHKWNFTDPAWDAGQIAPWPIDTAYTYERAIAILATIRASFSKAIKIPQTIETTCVNAGSEAGRDYTFTQFNHSAGKFTCFDASRSTALANIHEAKCDAVGVNQDKRPDRSARNGWQFTDQFGYVHKGTALMPKIICHVDICESLWHMGVRNDQLLGYFGGDMADVTKRCHGTLCMTANFASMIDVNTAPGAYTVDMAKIKNLAPDMIFDVAYCYHEKDSCLKDSPYKGLLSYSESVDDLKAMNIPMVQINVRGVGYIEVVETIQDIADGVTRGSRNINFDMIKNCDHVAEEMRRMSVVSTSTFCLTVYKSY